MSNWRPDGAVETAAMRRCLHELLARSDPGASFLPCDTARLPPVQRRRAEEREIGRHQVLDEAHAMLREIEGEGAWTLAEALFPEETR